MKSFKDTRAERRASSENTNTSRMSFKETKAKRTGVPYTPKTSIKSETKTATVPAATQRAKSTHSPSQDGYRRRQTNVPAEQSFFYKIGDIFDEKIKQAEKAKKQRDAQDEIVRDFFVSSAFKPYDEASADPFAAYKVKQAGRSYGGYINATHSAGELLREADDILSSTDYRGVYDSAEEDARSKRNAAYGKMSIEELEELKNKRDGFVSESGRNVSDFVNDVIDYAAVPSSAADAKEEKRNYIISSAGMYGTDADTVKRVLDRVDQGVDPYEAENIIASALGGNSDSENNVIDAFIRQKRAAAKDDEWEEADRKYAARAKAAWNNSGKAAKISLPGTGKLGGEWEEPEIEKKNSGYSDYIINSLSKKTLEKIKGNHAPEIRSVDDAVAQAYFKLTEPDYIFISLGNSISTERFANLDELNDRELATLVTIYNEDGADAADEYLSHMKYATDKRITERMYGNMEEFAGDHPFAASVLSVPMNTLGGVTGLSAQISALFGADVSQYDMSLLLSNASNKAREVVSEDMSGVGSFFYQTGMSMADCIFNMAVAYALTPGAGSNITEGMSPFEKIKAGVRDAGTTMNLIMSSSAASSTFSEKLSEGYTTSEAALLAGLSGFAEYITEKVSIETYLKSKGWLQSILSSMAAEGSEEFNSDVINSVGAKLLVGESEIEKQTAELMASGMSEKEAFNKAFTDWWAQAGLDALGGAISGLGFSFLSGGRIALEKADAVRNARKYTVPAAKDIIAQGGRAIDYAVDEGLKYGPDTSAGRYAALLAAQSEESGKYASRRQITRLLTKEITDASPRVEIDTQVRKNYDGSAPVFSRNDNGGALVRLGDRYVGKDEISFANLDPAVREVYAEAVTMTDENGRFDAERANKYAQLYDGSDPAEYRRVFNAAEEAGENGVTFAATEDLIGETDVSPRAALEAWAYGQKINSETSSTAEAVPLPQKGRQETPSSVTADTATPSPEGKAAKVQQNITKAQQNVPGITSSTAETVPLPQRGRQEVTPTVRLTRLADGTIAVTTDKGVVTTRQTIKLDDLSPEMQKPYAVAVTMKDADGNIDIDKANAYLAGYDGSPVNEYTAKFEKEYANAEIASSVTADAATPSPEGNAAKTQQNITKTQQNVAAGANETENLPSGVNESVDGVNENVNVNNEKTPAAERASRATFDDFEHRRVIKRQNGSVTDQSGTLTKDDLFVIGAVADKFGLDINILNKMDDGSWGEFVRIMHQINLSSKSDLFSSFMHELGHVIEFWAPEKFAGIKYGFRDFIIQKYGMRTMSDLLDDVKARYGNISDDAALVELACDQLEVVRDVESFAEEVAENLSKAGYTQSKIRQFLRDIADFLKRAADVIRSWAKGNDGKGGAKTAAGVYAERDAAYCKQLAEKFLDAADTAAENYKAHANGESAGAEADGKVKKMIANTKNMSWDRQISGFLGKKGILKRSDSLVLNKFTDNIVSENNLPNIIPVAVLSKSKSGKDMSHSLNDETLRTLEKDINNWSIAIKEASRKTVSYIFDSESEILPVFATFRQDSEFDRDKGNIARSIHLRTDVVSTIKALDGDSVVYIKKHKSSTSSRSLPQPETLTTKAKLVYIDDNTSSVKSQEKEENDQKYLSAVESGDMETAQRMVEEAAKAAGYTADESWKMDHRAPNSDDDTAHSMDDINGAYGGDDSIYDKRAAYYYGEGRSYDGQAISVIRSARNNPDKPIKVYRAVPTDIKDTRMRNGDWVAIVKDYAEEHGDRVLDGDFRIIENTVPAKHLYNNGDSINEWGYDNGNRDEVYKNTENNVKLQTVTYDDEGNIIPLSERFNEGNSDIRYMRPQEQSEVDELRSQLETERAEKADYEKKSKETIRDQKKLIEALRSGMVTRSGTIVSFEDTKNVIRGLNERYGVRLSLSDDTSELTRLYSQIANAKGVSSDDIIDLLRGFAKKIINKSWHEDTAFRDEHKAILKDWRENPIRLNRDQVSVLEHKYGSWTEARKHFFGKINFSQTNGTYLDDNFREWLTEYPELFPGYDENLTAGDQPLALLNAYDLTRPETVSELMDGFGGDTALAETYIANDLFDQYWNVGEVKTVTKAASEATAQTAAKYEKTMSEYRSAADKQIKALEGKVADSEEDFDKYRDRTEKEKLRKKIKDQMKWFQKRALSPNGQAHVPNEMYDALIAVCDAVDLTHNYDTQLGRKIALLKEKYAEIRNAGGRNGEALSANAAKYGMTPEELYDLKEEFDEGIEGELERLGKLFEDKSVFELKTDELSELYDVLETIKERFKHAGEILGDAENRTFAQSRQNFEEQQRKFVRTPRKLTRFMQDVTSPLRAVRYLSDYNADGELVKYFDALEQGTFKSSKYKMDMMKPFDDLRTGKNKAEYDRFAHDLVDSGMVDEYGKPVMLTHADIVSIIMTAERERASGGYTAHLQEGGITIPDRQLMKDGKPEKAKARSQRVRHVTTENIASLAEMLTDYDRKWIAASENLFNNVSPKILNDVMLAIKYKRFIQTGYYIPFITDSNFLVGDIDALKFDARLKEAGYMKEVTKGANAPLMLLGIDDLVNRHVDNVSTQGGLAVPLYNLNRFYNGPVGDTSIKRIVQTAFGEGGHGAGAKNIIEQVMTDLQKNRGGDRTWVDSLVSNYVSAVLTFNPSVTIKQMASYEAAGVYLSQRALGERFSMFGKSAVRFKKICDEIDKHTGLHYMRRIGLSSAEIAQMTEHYGVIDKGLDKLHLPEGINPKKWIQFTDCLTTAALWEATKKQVGINYAAMDKRGETHAEVGSDEYWNDVIALYERVISDTQPMYDVLHRPEFSKKDNKLFKVMNMFKTVPFQNLGILADAAGEYSAMRNAEGEVLKNAKATEQEKEQARQNAKTAKKKLGRAVMSQAFGVISFALMTAAVALGLHREDDYRDEYGDLTFESVLNGYAWNLAEGLWSNTLPFLPANGVNLVRNNFKFDAISETPAGEIVNELITDLTKGYNQITDVFADKTMPLKEKINTAFGRNSYFLRFATTAGDAAGFPAANTKKLTESIYNIITDPKYIGGERKKKQLIQKLYDGRVEGDEKKAGEAYSAARKQYNNADIDTGIAALLIENPTIESMAKAYADGDWDSYDKDYDKLYAMGFSDVQILKARNKYLKSLEPDEEYGLEKESTDVVEVSYERAAQAVADGDIETIERAVRDYADKGKSDSSIKSGIRNVIKPIYATSDEKKRKEIRETLIEYFGFTDKTHWDEWENPYTYDDLYSAITSGAADQAATAFEYIASAEAKGDKGKEKAREKIAEKLKPIYRSSNGKERVSLQDFLKKNCGFPNNYNFNSWLNKE